MQSEYKSLRIFQNDWLERLTHVHPITPLVFWTPVVAFLVYLSVVEQHLGFTSIASWGAAGLLSWSLAEYLLHRFVFHYENDHPVFKKLHFLIHGVHHVDPKDPSRLVMPPLGGLVIAAILFGIFRLLLGAYVYPFFAFFLVGYLCYDYIHFSVHHFRPRTAFGRWVKQNHMHHHFIDPQTRWGVSSPLWDYVFGTMEKAKDKTTAA